MKFYVFYQGGHPEGQYFAAPDDGTVSHLCDVQAGPFQTLEDADAEVDRLDQKDREMEMEESM